MKTYEELRKINVNEHVEKKNNLTYLSWAWAVDILFQNDPEASWNYTLFDGKPWMDVNGTFMVFCTVKAFGRERMAQLPIMDYRNKPITAFTAFDLNTTMQRCLAKAISLHGIGLYIYAGEDVPPDAGEALVKEVTDANVKPSAGAMESLETDMQNWIRDELAPPVNTLFKRNDLKGMYDEYQQAKGKLTSNEQGIALWECLDSKTRTAITTYKKMLKETKVVS